MSWRKWVVRSVVYGIIGVCALGAFAYQRWTNPVAVRDLVVRKLSEVFPGAIVSIDSASLRLFGGIQLNDVRLTRKDDPERNEFLHVPSVVIYHDKEKMTEGTIALRKLELHRPRLYVRKQRDGGWNVQGLTGQIRLDLAIPTIVVQQGTIHFEDRASEAKLSPLEINDVHFTLINDPIATVSLRGGANSDSLGKLSWQGAWQRASGVVNMAFKSVNLPVTHLLANRFIQGASAEALHGLTLKARADVEGQLDWNPTHKPGFCYDIRGSVRQGTVDHPQLPIPLDSLSALFQCVNGEFRLDKLSAKSGAAELTVKGRGALMTLDQEFEAEIDIQHLPLSHDLCARLPEKLRNLSDIYQPNGPTTIHVSCARTQGEWSTLANGKASYVSLRPENLSIAFKKYPYPLQRLSGSLDYNLLNRHVQVDVTGYAGERPVFIQGYWTGEGAQADASFDIRADDVVIEDSMIEALPPVPQKLARSFHGKGRFDVKAHIRHEPNAPTYHNEFHLRFHEASVLWDDFPYPLSNVSGFLDIYPSHWEFREFQGIHRGGAVVVNGKSIPTQLPNGEKGFGVSVEIAGRNVAMDDDLHKALRPIGPLWKAWEIFHPQGRLTFTASIDRPTASIYDLDVNVDLRGPTIDPSFFRYGMSDLSGQFHFHKHRLEMTNVHAKHGNTTMVLQRGSVDLHPGGGYYSDLEVQARELRVDSELIEALPRSVKATAHSLKLSEPVRVQSRIVVAQSPEPTSPPDVFWDGQLWLQNATFSPGLELSGVKGTIACRGRYNGHQLMGIEGNILLDEVTAFKQNFQAARIKFEVLQNAPDRLIMNLWVPIYGGTIAGEMRVDFNSSTRYELNLAASNIDLQQFGKQNLGPKTQIQGEAKAQLHLMGQGSNVDTLEGNGSIDVPHGKLGKDLPLLLDIIKFLGLHWPDGTMFEELHTQYAIQGRRVQLKKMQLVGNAISLTGKGEFNLDGTDVLVDLYPTWARLDQFLPASIRNLPPALSRNLLTIEMRGKVDGNPDHLRFNKHVIPIVVDPLRTLRNQVMSPVLDEKKN